MTGQKSKRKKLPRGVDPWRPPDDRRSTWTLEHHAIAEGGPHYDRGPELPIDTMPPIPVHAQTDAALAAVEAVRIAGRARRTVAPPPLAAAVAVRPPDHDPPAGAARLAELAQRLGFTAHTIAIAHGWRVEGYDLTRGLAFRCDWVRSKAVRGTWHEARRRWGMVHDTRPVGVGANTRTGLAKHRTAGLDEHHLAQVAGPEGSPVGVTEVTRRLKALA